MSYQVNLDKFSGPLDLLLQLIEQKNLEVTDISLAQVTQEYLLYFQKNETILSQDLADFLVIASTLLLIKSKAILPTLEFTEEEKEEVLDLESRLRLLKFFKEKSLIIKESFNTSGYLFARIPWLEQKIQFSAPNNINCQILFESYKKILTKFNSEQIESIVVKNSPFISLEARIKELVSRLTQNNKFSLEEITTDNKMDFIVTFLAILHLAKEKIIDIKQNKLFESIWITNQS